MNAAGVTRRLVLAGGVAGLCGCDLWAQATDDGSFTLVEGRTFGGSRGTASGGAGGEGIRVRSAMRIANCTFQDLGTGARVPQPVDRLIIEDCQADNMYRFLDTTAGGTATDATLTDFTIRRLRAERLEHGCLRLRYRSARGLIEDVTTRCRDTGGDLYCVGFQLDDQASDITYRRCAAHDFREVTRSSGSYWNGDGFIDERGNSAIRYVDCVATNCTDGGFDLKSAGVAVERCTAGRNKRNFRLWNSGTLTDCESHEPVSHGGTGAPSHFSFHGDVSSYRIVRPRVRAPAGNDAAVFLFNTNAPARIVIENADVDAPSAPLIRVENGPEPQITFVPDRAQQNIRTAS